MKRIPYLWAYMLALPLCACGGENDPEPYDYKTGETDLADFSLNYHEDKGGFVVEDYHGEDKDVFVPGEVTIGNLSGPVVEIAGYAFANRKNIHSLYLPESVHSIGAYAFHESSLRMLYTTPYLFHIDPDAYANTNLAIFEKDNIRYLPGRLGKYGYAIGYSKKMSIGGQFKLNLSEQCEAVGDQALSEGGFYVYYPKATIAFGDNKSGGAAYCPNWEAEFTPFDLQVAKAGSWSFAETYVKKVTFLDKLRNEIGDHAFAYCERLSEVVLTDRLDSIGAGAFYGCTALTTINLPRHLAEIRGSLFGGCSSLASIELPAGLTAIGGKAFEECVSLTSLKIPSGVSDLGKKDADGGSFGGDTFRGCTNLEKLFIPKSVTTLSGSDDNFKDCGKLTIYCEAESKPEGYRDGWNNGRNVVWGVSAEEFDRI